MLVATFNCNSVRQRLGIILDWLAKYEPDALALQETKCTDADFPAEAFAQAGWQAFYRGEKSYNGVAWITINRPDKMNAFRGTTCDELIKALNKAGYDKSIGAIVLAGAGEKAFCTGGDQSAHDGNYDGRGTIGLPMEELHDAIRNVPKPVIARVQGFAIGGGNVLCTICDLTICSEKAVFGQVGPKMGSVDPGYGTAFLARVVGEKKAREIWYLNKRYTGAEAVAMGLANVCVPHDQLDATVQ